jgi:hypothetical protein
MLFSCHERKIFIRGRCNICINVLFNVVIVEFKMVRFNMCVRLGAIQVSGYDFKNMYFFCSKTECSVFALNQEIEVCMYIDLVSD